MNTSPPNLPPRWQPYYQGSVVASRSACQAVIASMIGVLSACAMPPSVALPPPPAATARPSEPGTLLGVLLASDVGAYLAASDVPVAQEAIERAHMAPLRTPVAWENPETGNSGTIVAIRSGYLQNGAFCREYRQTITVRGRTEQAEGVLCRQGSGRWRLVPS